MSDYENNFFMSLDLDNIHTWKISQDHLKQVFLFVIIQNILFKVSKKLETSDILLLFYIFYVFWHFKI